MSHHWGYVAAVVSAILFGVSSTINKIALENVNPTVIAGLIYLSLAFSCLPFTRRHYAQKFSQSLARQKQKQK
jgi:drug/metabolite transporter (DMT)-like permease